MAPKALPITKRLVIFPVISILSSTSDTVVGNKEAAEMPKPAAPTQIDMIENGDSKMIPILSRHPIRSTRRIVLGLK